MAKVFKGSVTTTGAAQNPFVAKDAMGVTVGNFGAQGAGKAAVEKPGGRLLTWEPDDGMAEAGVESINAYQNE